jgi:putative CocE/NonD family hydrolase
MRRSYRKSIAVLIVALLLVPGAAALGHPAGLKPALKGTPEVTYKVKRINEKWSMSDGVKLPVSVFYPVRKNIFETFPVVVFAHPWLFDKTVYDNLAAKYASHGYVGLTYTVRGWFKAEGQINSMDPDVEMKDLSRIITLAGRDGRFPVRKDRRGPVVGVTGYSMGGMHSYMIAPRADPRSGDPCDPRVRAVAPVHGGVDLLFTHYPYGAGKLLWTVLLLSGAFTGNTVQVMLNLLEVVMDPNLNPWQKITQLTQNVVEYLKLPVNKVDPALATMFIGLQRRVDDLEQMRSFFLRRSARFWCDEEMDGQIEHPITVPTLQVAGWKDDLFVPNQSLNALNSMISAPKRLIMTNHGHLGDLNFPWKFGYQTTPEQEWIEGQIEAWFDRFLKGKKNGIENQPAVTYYRDWDPGTYGTSGTWPISGTTDVSYNLGGNTGPRQGSMSTDADYGPKPDTLVNTGISGSISLPYFNDVLESMGGPYFNLPEKIDLFDIPSQRYNYVSEPMTSDEIIGGTPRIRLTYKSTGKYTQLNPRLYEITADGKKILVTRGYYEGYNTQTGIRLSTGEKPIEMNACCHKVKAGSRLMLEIETADPLQVMPVMGFSRIELYHDEPGASLLVLPMAPG